MSSAKQAKTFVVIPAYREEDAIARVVQDLIPAYPSVVVVDDASGDRTASRALAAGATVLRHPINLGQGAALQTGIDFALAQGADVIVTFDADGQHRVADIAPVIAELRRAEADIALGSRFLGEAIGLSTFRRWFLKAAILFTWLTSGIKLTDAHNGFRVLTRTAATKIRIRQNRMAHASEIVDEIRRHGLKFVEVPVTIEYTEYSRAKGQKLSNSVNILIDLFVARLHK